MGNNYYISLLSPFGLKVLVWSVVHKRPPVPAGPPNHSSSVLPGCSERHWWRICPLFYVWSSAALCWMICKQSEQVLHIFTAGILFMFSVPVCALLQKKKTKTHLYPFTRIRKQQTSANISLLSSLSLCILCIQSCIGWLCSHKCLSAPALTGCDENNSPHYTWISLSLGQIQPNRIETDYSDPVLVYWWWWFRSNFFFFFCG